MSVITLNQVTKSYATQGGPHFVLKDLTTTFPCEACTVILGKSGSGKTTLLRLLSGLEKPDSGTIEWPSGIPYGMMFQEARLMPWLTCRQNAGFGLKDTAENRKKIDSLLALVHLTEAADQYPHELSGGMQQRTALIRTLAQDSRFILMDEPFAALDYFTRRHLQEELIQMKKEAGIGILLVTHNIEEAMTLGDQILVIQNGTFPYRESIPVAAENRDLLSPYFIQLKRRILAAL